MNTRPAAVAGQFYHKDRDLLEEQIETWLIPVLDVKKNIKAVIVPHAGYVYSGETASYAYMQIRKQKNRFNRVIVVGPSHHLYFKGCALPECDHFQTPLGKIRICKKAIKEAKNTSLVTLSDELHRPEHSIEVQLPFIQSSMIPDIELIPLLVGDISEKDLAKIIKPLWTEDTLLIISSDLSHFHTDSDARKIDADTCSRIENYEAGITPQQACGCTGINALLLLAKEQQYKIWKLKQTNSSETSGDKSRVVGYVSYLITDA